MHPLDPVDGVIPVGRFWSDHRPWSPLVAYVGDRGDVIWAPATPKLVTKSRRPQAFVPLFRWRPRFLEGIPQRPQLADVDIMI